MKSSLPNTIKLRLKPVDSCGLPLYANVKKGILLSHVKVFFLAVVHHMSLRVLLNCSMRPFPLGLKAVILIFFMCQIAGTSGEVVLIQNSFLGPSDLS